MNRAPLSPALMAFLACLLTPVRLLGTELPAQTAWAWEGRQGQIDMTAGDARTEKPAYRWAAGVSYTGLQLRYQMSSRWAAEGRFQFGSADSTQGTVHSQVFGMRGYRFFPFRERLSWYVGAEGAYAQAEASGSSY